MSTLKIIYPLKRMCSGCPFNPNSLPGWLGDYDGPEDVLFHVKNEAPFLCHTRINYEEEGWDSEPLAHCFGALAFMKKDCKIPRNKESANAVREATTNQAILWPEDIFIAHHKRAIEDS